MKTISIIVLLTLMSTVAFTQQSVQNVLDDYLKIKEALVKSDADKAAGYAGDMILTVNNTDATKFTAKDKSTWEEEKENLLKNATLISKTTDIEKQRTAFSKLSDATWRLVKETDGAASTVYHQYCPMKKMYWLSAEPAIKNPYYGSSMLTCGKVADKKLKK